MLGMELACLIERLVRGLMGLALSGLFWSELAERELASSALACSQQAWMKRAANRLAWTQLVWKEQRVEKTTNVRNHQYKSLNKLTFGAGGP